MNPTFWTERWQAGQIGFHNGSVHPLLEKHWTLESLNTGEKVFVPLCGKSEDLYWLSRSGHEVLGVELSRIAVESFFEEHDLKPAFAELDHFGKWSAQNIELLCGDFFDMQPADMAGIRLVYDRAALIALPPDMRRRYADHLQQILGDGSRILLITLTYPQYQMSGPPFSVDEAEVHELFDEGFEIRLLEEENVLSNHQHFAARGLTELVERVYLLKRLENRRPLP